MVSVMAFTSRAPRLQTSADRYYRFFDEGQQIGVDLVVRFENALMQKYDPGKPAIMASNHARARSVVTLSEWLYAEAVLAQGASAPLGPAGSMLNWDRSPPGFTAMIGCGANSPRRRA